MAVFRIAPAAPHRVGNPWKENVAKNLELVADTTSPARDASESRSVLAVGRFAPVRDWVCEILSPSNEERDLVDKMQTLRRFTQ